MIVRGAHAVRQGEMPDFAPHEGLQRDLFLIERADPCRRWTRSSRWCHAGCRSTTAWTR